MGTEVAIHGNRNTTRVFTLIHTHDGNVMGLARHFTEKQIAHFGKACSGRDASRAYLSLVTSRPQTNLGFTDVSNLRRKWKVLYRV
eukprot:127357-Amphidinium_carterae.1